MVGTAPNILIAKVRVGNTGKPFGLFDFTPVGLDGGAGRAGVRRASPGNCCPAAAAAPPDWMPRSTSRTTLPRPTSPPTRPWSAARVAELEAMAEGDVQVAMVIRERFRRFPPRADSLVREDDLLLLRGEPSDLDRLVRAPTSGWPAPRAARRRSSRASSPPIRPWSAARSRRRSSRSASRSASWRSAAAGSGSASGWPRSACAPATSSCSAAPRRRWPTRSASSASCRSPTAASRSAATGAASGRRWSWPSPWALVAVPCPQRRRRLLPRRRRHAADAHDDDARGLRDRRMARPDPARRPHPGHPRAARHRRHRPAGQLVLSAVQSLSGAVGARLHPGRHAGRDALPAQRADRADHGTDRGQRRQRSSATTSIRS